MGEAAVARELEQAMAAYERVLKCSPKSAAAPGWQVNPVSLTVQDRLRFLYCSDTRGSFPFLPMCQGQAYQTLQIPTTLPTLDELLGCDGLRGDLINDALICRLRRDHLNVHTIHAEVEGRAQLSLFEALLRRLAAHGVEYVTLSEVANALLRQGWEKIPRSLIRPQSIPGRAGQVACQVVDECP
jgi:peptidoglycan/xylan/chitin deacetylase (PgdA/CDA1 family)